MTIINMELDELSSLLVSYHILCAPTELNKTYNPDVFQNFAVSSEQKERHSSFLKSKNISSENTDYFRRKLVFPERHSLDELFLYQNIPEGIKTDLRTFETEFKPYMEKVKKELGPAIANKTREGNDVIDKIYDISEQLTGIKVEKPEKVNIRIVEGMAPSSGFHPVNENIYIVMQKRNVLDTTNHAFLTSLIHESVGHQTAQSADSSVQYTTEEVFVKLFTKKIAEQIVGAAVDYCTGRGIDKIKFDKFNENWSSLNSTNFRSWYKNCLR